MRRRHFLVSATVSAFRGAASDEAGTFVYKRTGGCEIKADVFNPAGADARPVAVWIHGGALILGSRKLPSNAGVLRALLEAGFAVISIDYRLAPETKLPAIIEDVQDAFRWIRREASTIRVDPDRIVVCGGSAGGYLTLMTGFCVNPRPKALVSFWGYGDIAGPWYSRPDPFYLKEALVSRAEALSAVGSTPIAEAPANNDRGKFYLHCRQHGTWPREVAGHDPANDDAWFTRYCPLRNVTREYPPTMLVHGTADTDVPYEQSKLMDDRLRVTGVQQQLVTVPGGGHGIGNITLEEQGRIYRDAATFLTAKVLA